MIELNRLYYQYLVSLMLPIKIGQIKNKFEFKKSFDFYLWLSELKIWSDLYKEHEDLTIAREMKSQFDGLVSSVDSLRGLLDVFFNHRNEFSGKIDPFQEEVLFHNPKIRVTHEELYNLLGEFKNLWQRSLDSLPEIGRGRPPNTHNIRVVNLLVMMFIKGSELKPICYRSDHKEEQYVGSFYDFMIDMLPVLQAYGITFINVKDASLGRYAVEIIIKRLKDKPYIHT